MNRVGEMIIGEGVFRRVEVLYVNGRAFTCGMRGCDLCARVWLRWGECVKRQRGVLEAVTRRDVEII